MKFCSLSSSSSGNSHYVGTENTNILVDAGFSGKKIEEFLSIRNLDPTSLEGILITHEHTDHIKGAGVLSRRYDIPIYANKLTWQVMGERIGKIKDKNIKIFNNEEYFNIKDLSIKPIKIFHDAVDPVGYILNNNNKQISIITDTGKFDLDLKNKIKDSDLYFLESNHDEFMLRNGLYPYQLKERILSDKGHLSNETASDLLLELLRGRQEKVILGHLSKDNNVPELAYETTKSKLEKAYLDVGKDVFLGLAHRNKPTELVSI